MMVCGSSRSADDVAELPAPAFQQVSDVIAQTEIKGMPHLPFGRLGAVLDLGEKLRFHPCAAMGDPLGVRLRFADGRRQTLAQTAADLLSKPWSTFRHRVPLRRARYAVPFLTVEGKAGDGQRLTQLAGFF